MYLDNEKITTRLLHILLLLFALGAMLTYGELLFDVSLSLIRYAINIVALLIIFRIFIISKLAGKVFKNYNSITYIYIISILYSFIVGLSSLFSAELNYLSLKKFIAGEMILLFLPLLIFVGYDLVLWRYIRKIAIFLAFIFIVTILGRYNLYSSDPSYGGEFMVRFLASGSAFLFLSFPYYTKHNKFIIFFTTFLSLIVMLQLGRRNMIVFLVLIIMFSLFVIYMHKDGTLYSYKISNFFLIFSLVFIASFFYQYLNLDLTILTQRYYDQIDYGLFHTREKLIVEFVNDFNSNPSDWLTGRGFNGTFLSSISDASNLGHGYGERELIENGYLHIILKFGLWHLIPFILLSTKAIKRGIFQSSNLLSKASGMIVLINIIDMIGYGLPNLSLKYLIVLLSLNICLSDKVIGKSDKYINTKIGNS